jgi:hypothetical protein
MLSQSWIAQSIMGREVSTVDPGLIGRASKKGAIHAASFDAPGRNPEHSGRREGIDSSSLPPGNFVSEGVVVPVMGSAQGDSELVAHLASHCAELSEPEMVGVSGTSSADETWLRCHEFEMSLIAMAARLADRKFTFLDFGRSGIGLKMCRRRRGIVGVSRRRRDN